MQLDETGDQSMLNASEYYMDQKFHKSIDAIDLRKRRREKSGKSNKSRSRSNKLSQKRSS